MFGIAAKAPSLPLEPPVAARPSCADPEVSASDWQLRIAELCRLNEQWKYAAAETLARSLLPQAEALFGLESTQVADVLDLLEGAMAEGWPRYQLSLHGEARRTNAERAFAIREREAGPQNPDLARALTRLSKVHAATWNPDRAIELAKRAVELLEETRGPGHPEVGNALHELAYLWEKKSELAKARQYHERALRLLTQALGSEDPDVARSMVQLAGALRGVGERERAAALEDGSLAIMEKALGPEHPDVAGVLFFMAGRRELHGEWRTGIEKLYQRVVKIREKAFGPTHPSLILPLNSLGRFLYLGVGRYEEALEAYHRLLAIQDSIDAKMAGIEENLASMGVLYMDMGDFASAKIYTQRSFDVDSEASGGIKYAMQRYANLGEILLRSGDYDEARPILEQVVEWSRELTRSIAPFDPELVFRRLLHAGYLKDLGRLNRLTGNLGAARPLLEEAMKICEGSPFDSARDMWCDQTRTDFAALLRDKGEHEEARRQYGLALVEIEKRVGPVHPDVGDALQGFAWLSLRGGDPAAARDQFARALSIREKMVGDNDPQTAESLAGLARALWMSGDREAGLKGALRAERASVEHVRLAMRASSERQALSFAAARPSAMDLILTAATDGAKASSLREIWDVVSSARGLVLDEVAGRRGGLSSEANPEVADALRRMQAASTRLANLLVSSSNPENLEGHLAMVSRLRRAKEEAEELLALRSQSFRQRQARSAAGMAQVLVALPPGSALLAYARYPHRASGAGPGCSTPSYLAMMARAGVTDITAVPLGPAEPIDILVQRWQKEVSSPPRGARPAQALAEGAYRRAGVALRRAVWDTVITQLEGARQVFIVPDGSLSLVSFASLPAEGSRYVVENGPVIHYLSAERDLVREPVHRDSARGLLVVGGPDYNAAPSTAALHGPEGAHARAPGAGVAAEAGSFSYRGNRSACGTFQSLSFDPLPASLREAREVASIWEERGRSSGPVERLTGSQASESAFKLRAPRSRVLHLATHGFFLEGRCASALEPGRGGAGLAEESSPATAVMRGESPLLLSGLALAGANRRETAGAEEDDGILTAEEISALNLSVVEWAVLSACETGVGDVRAGEGVFGLRRAFDVAGAGTLIMSLWSVEDESARQWMKRLYEGRLRQGLTTSEAVHGASLAMLKQRREDGESTHPFHWAGFVAAGDWR